MSSDDPFVILGLDPKGATEKDIKRAYAKQLKTTRPDDDPQGFMALRTALEDAKAQLHWRAYDDDEDDDEDDDDYGGSEALDEEITVSESAIATVSNALTEPSPDSPLARESETSDAEDEDDRPWDQIAEDRRHAPEGSPDFVSIFSEGADWAEPDGDPDTETDATDDLDEDEDDENDSDSVSDPDVEAVNLTMTEIAALYDTPEDAKDWNNWLKLLDDDRVASLNAFQILSHRLRADICDRTDFDTQSTNAFVKNGLDAEILIQLDERFGWSKQSVTGWYQSQQNTWIRRLVEDAEYKTGRRTNGAWGRPPARRIEVIPEAIDELTTPEDRQAAIIGPMVWMVIRIILVAGLIGVIRAMLD